jgi:hypothetical protein
MIGITARSLLLAVFWLGASCPLAASQLSAAKRVTAQQFGYDHTWRGPGTQGRPDQRFRRGLGSRSGFSEQAYSGRCYHCLGFCNYPGDPTRGPIRPRRLQRRRHRGHSYAGTGSLIHSVSLRRSSSSASATATTAVAHPAPKPPGGATSPNAVRSRWSRCPACADHMVARRWQHFTSSVHGGIAGHRHLRLVQSVRAKFVLGGFYTYRTPCGAIDGAGAC